MSKEITTETRRQTRRVEDEETKLDSEEKSLTRNKGRVNKIGEIKLKNTNWHLFEIFFKTLQSFR